MWQACDVELDRGMRAVVAKLLMWLCDGSGVAALALQCLVMCQMFEPSGPGRLTHTSRKVEPSPLGGEFGPVGALHEKHKRLPA